MNWKRFLRREAADAEQQEELEFYVDVTAEEYVERGMNPQAARAAARRKLGNMTLVREEIYRMNTVTFAENALRTARQTVRLLRTHPGFVLTVVLSLALGIGANTAIFSVVHGVLIRPLPYPHADALVGIYNRQTINGQVSRMQPRPAARAAATIAGPSSTWRVEFRRRHRDRSRRARTGDDGDGDARRTPCVRGTYLVGPLVLAGRRFTGRRSNGDPQPRVLATKIRRRPGDSRPYCGHRFRSAPDRRCDAAGFSLRGPVA